MNDRLVPERLAWAEEVRDELLPDAVRACNLVFEEETGGQLTPGMFHLEDDPSSGTRVVKIPLPDRGGAIVVTYSDFRNEASSVSGMMTGIGGRTTKMPDQLLRALLPKLKKLIAAKKLLEEAKENAVTAENAVDRRVEEVAMENALRAYKLLS